MRLTYLDILEQCFHNKFRGYNKQEVDTFLHLVADDFKALAEELKDKEREIDLKIEENRKLRQNLDRLQSSQNNASEELKKKAEAQPDENNPLAQLTPEMIKEKARKIFSAAKQHAEQTTANANKELESLQSEIQKLQEQKQKLMENIRATAVDHLNKFKTGT